MIDERGQCFMPGRRCDHCGHRMMSEIASNGAVLKCVNPNCAKGYAAPRVITNNWPGHTGQTICNSPVFEGVSNG